MRRLVLVAAALLMGTLFLASAPATPALAAAGPPSTLSSSGGYTLVSADGGVYTYGNTAFHGSAGGSRLNATMVDMASTSSGDGYWLLGQDGGVFTFGNAQFFGSTGSIRLNQPVISMSPTPTNNGYWFAATDGGIFAYGDAPFKGSMGGKKLNSPIVGMASTPSGNGYWEVAADGGIFAFGDAPFLGSLGSVKLNKPIVGMQPTESGRGYWLVASDGGVFSYGDANFYGSAGGSRLNQPIVDMASTPSNGGYWLVASDGGVFTYGDAAFMGSAASSTKSRVAAISTPKRARTSETSIFYYPWYATATHDGSYRHWDQGGNTPPDYIGADYWPSRGVYSSADTSVLNAQMAEIRAAGIDTVVYSWWGRGSWEDQVMPVFLNAAKANGLRVAAHMEPYPGRDSTLAADYAYFLGQGVTEFYVYNADKASSAALKAANDSLPGTVRVWEEALAATTMKDGSFAVQAKAHGATGIYSYAGFGFSGADFGKMCDDAHALKLLCSPSVAPGFSAERATTLDRFTTDRKNGQRYDDQWAGAFYSGADMISITSYNEWHEGTNIEPAVPHCMPDNTCMKNYIGAYGTSGDAASAYMDRTRYWTTIYKSLYPPAHG